MVHVNLMKLRNKAKHWITNPRDEWHNLWEPLWNRWVENASYDEWDYSLEIHLSYFSKQPLTKWQVKLLSVVFNYEYWYYEEVELCPWQNEVKEFGIPYHSRF